MEEGGDRKCKLNNKAEFRTRPVLSVALIHVKPIFDSIN
jgi:hypothetical protein